MFDGALPLSYRGLVGHLPVFFGFFSQFHAGIRTWDLRVLESGFQPLDHAARCELLETTFDESIYQHVNEPNDCSMFPGFLMRLPMTLPMRFGFSAITF